MQQYEYSVMPAPARGEKARGARTGAERFAYALTVEINRMAENGWEYIRAETLPCEERSGLTSRTTVYHNVLVFRRLLPALTVQPQEPSAQPVAAPSAAPVLAPAAPPRASEPAPQQSDAENFDDPGLAPSQQDEQPETGPNPAPAFIQRPPLAARTEAQATLDPTNGNRLGPASR